MIQGFFKLKEARTTVKIEILAGITTFSTMAYIIFLNPYVLSQAGMDYGSVFVATCLAAAAGCFFMGLYANYPVALAPGMGLNAFFSFTVVAQMGYSWEVALGAVFVSAVLFFILSTLKIRGWIINGTPLSLRSGVTAGIGLFLGFLGLQHSGLVIGNPVTMVAFGDVSSWNTAMAALGFILISGLYSRGIRGSVIIGIFTITFLSIAAGYVNVNVNSLVSMPPSLEPTFFKLDWKSALDIGMLNIIFSFLFVDMFDTSGTLMAVSQQGNLLDKKGHLPNLNKAMVADSGASVFGSLLGTSTTTSYIESGAGIAVGGRTGLTAVVVGLLFLLSLFLSPMAKMIPAYATAPALFFVAILMINSLTQVDWKDMTEAAPVGVTLITIPLTFSVATGIALGIIAWTGVKLISGKYEQVSLIMLVLSTVFILKMVFF